MAYRSAALVSSLTLLLTSGVAFADGAPGSPQCSDGLDNDSDGYVDAYDPNCGIVGATAPECTVPITDTSFSIREDDRTSSAMPNMDARCPMVAADIDFDGVTEFVLRRSATGASAATNNNQWTVIDAETLMEESVITVPTAEMEVFHPGVAVGQLDGSGPLEVAFLAGPARTGSYYPYVASLDVATSTWTVTQGPDVKTLGVTNAMIDGPSRGWATSIADMDEDGTPEIVTGNLIWRYTGGASPAITLLMNGMNATGATAKSVGNNTTNTNYVVAFSVPIDIVPADPGLEIAAGNQIYIINTAVMPWTARIEQVAGTLGDGMTSVADMNLDGQLDVVVAHQSGAYIWTLAGGSAATVGTPTVLGSWAYSGVYTGRPAIGEFSDDDLEDDGLDNDSVPNWPETLFITQHRLRAFNLHDTSAQLFNLVVDDGSAATKAAIYDLNGDGTAEIIYRDEVELRIMYGGPIASAPANVNTGNRNYKVGPGAADADVTVPCVSGTRLEGPLILDSDNDGQSEIAVTCNPNLVIFESGGAPWTPSRRIWNQYYYHITNVNDDGTIPTTQQDVAADFPAGSGRYPLNVAITQSDTSLLTATPGTTPAIDARVQILGFERGADCGTGGGELVVNIRVFNDGDTGFFGTTPIAFYNGNPATVGTFIGTAVTGGGVAAGGMADFAVTIPDQVGSFQLYAVINDDGSDATSAPVLVQNECDDDNNVATITPVFCCTDETDGGTDTGCPAGLSCDEDATPAGACVPCTSHADCPAMPNNACDFATNECVPCVDDEMPGLDTGCTGAAPVCDTSGATPTCLPCADSVAMGIDDGCSAGAPVCDTSGAVPTCVPCDDSTMGGLDDGCSAAAPVCVGSGSSAMCILCEDSDTGSGALDNGCAPGTPVCATGADPLECVECLGNRDCGGAVCDLATNTCAPCINDSVLGVDSGCTSGMPVCNTSGGTPMCETCADTSDGGVDLGCGAAAPACVVIGGAPTCAPCEDSVVGGRDNGCGAAAPVCDTSDQSPFLIRF